MNTTNKTHDCKAYYRPERNVRKVCGMCGVVFDRKDLVYAIDNLATHAHICKFCLSTLPDSLEKKEDTREKLIEEATDHKYFQD